MTERTTRASYCPNNDSICVISSFLGHVVKKGSTFFNVFFISFDMLIMLINFVVRHADIYMKALCVNLS